MVEEYEDNIIAPPMEFRDKPIPVPRTKRMVKEYESDIVAQPMVLKDKPVPAPGTKIRQVNRLERLYRII